MKRVKQPFSPDHARYAAKLHDICLGYSFKEEKEEDKTGETEHSLPELKNKYIVKLLLSVINNRYGKNRTFRAWKYLSDTEKALLANVSLHHSGTAYKFTIRLNKLTEARLLSKNDSIYQTTLKHVTDQVRRAFTAAGISDPLYWFFIEERGSTGSKPHLHGGFSLAGTPEEQAEMIIQLKKHLRSLFSKLEPASRATALRIDLQDTVNDYGKPADKAAWATYTMKHVDWQRHSELCLTNTITRNAEQIRLDINNSLTALRSLHASP